MSKPKRTDPNELTVIDAARWWLLGGKRRYIPSKQRDKGYPLLGEGRAPLWRRLFYRLRGWLKRRAKHQPLIRRSTGKVVSVSERPDLVIDDRDEA